jgi:hypothetical protein
MFEWMKSRRELAKFDEWERKEHAQHAMRVEEAKKAGEKPPHDGELASTLFMIEDLRNATLTRVLLRQARHYAVPTPHHSESAWEESVSTGQRFLSVKAQAELRSAIRKERTERWDFGLKVLAALTGVLGTLIGLIAMLKK